MSERPHGGTEASSEPSEASNAAVSLAPLSTTPTLKPESSAILKRLVAEAVKLVPKIAAQLIAVDEPRFHVSCRFESVPTGPRQRRKRLEFWRLERGNPVCGVKFAVGAVSSPRPSWNAIIRAAVGIYGA